MRGLPLLSSRQIVRALERLGFEPVTTKKGGSHRSFSRRDPATGLTFVTVVQLGAKEVPRGTLASIIRLAGLSVEEFLEAVK